jgi:hypothetical protein
MTAQSVLLAIRADPEKMLRKARETESGEKADEAERRERSVEPLARVDGSLDRDGTGSGDAPQRDDEDEEEDAAAAKAPTATLLAHLNAPCLPHRLKKPGGGPRR